MPKFLDVKIPDVLFQTFNFWTLLISVWTKISDTLLKHGVSRFTPKNIPGNTVETETTYIYTKS